MVKRQTARPGKPAGRFKPVIKPRGRRASPGARGFRDAPEPSRQKFDPTSPSFRSLPPSVQQRLAAEGRVIGRTQAQIASEQRAQAERQVAQRAEVRRQALETRRQEQQQRVNEQRQQVLVATRRQAREQQLQAERVRVTRAAAIRETPEEKALTLEVGQRFARGTPRFEALRARRLAEAKAEVPGPVSVERQLQIGEGRITVGGVVTPFAPAKEPIGERQIRAVERAREEAVTEIGIAPQPTFPESPFAGAPPPGLRRSVAAEAVLEIAKPFGTAIRELRDVQVDFTLAAPPTAIAQIQAAREGISPVVPPERGGIGTFVRTIEAPAGQVARQAPTAGALAATGLGVGTVAFFAPVLVKPQVAIPAFELIKFTATGEVTTPRRLAKTGIQVGAFQAAGTAVRGVAKGVRAVREARFTRQLARLERAQAGQPFRGTRFEPVKETFRVDLTTGRPVRVIETAQPGVTQISPITGRPIGQIQTRIVPTVQRGIRPGEKFVAERGIRVLRKEPAIVRPPFRGEQTRLTQEFIGLTRTPTGRIDVFRFKLPPPSKPTAPVRFTGRQLPSGLLEKGVLRFGAEFGRRQAVLIRDIKTGQQVFVKRVTEIPRTEAQRQLDPFIQAAAQERFIAPPSPPPPRTFGTVFRAFLRSKKGQLIIERVPKTEIQFRTVPRRTEFEFRAPGQPRLRPSQPRIRPSQPELRTRAESQFQELIPPATRLRRGVPPITLFEEEERVAIAPIQRERVEQRIAPVVLFEFDTAAVPRIRTEEIQRVRPLPETIAPPITGPITAQIPAQVVTPTPAVIIPEQVVPELPSFVPPEQVIRELPEEIPVRPTPPPILPEFPLPTADRRMQVQGFNAFAKEKGKNVRLNKEPLTKNRAINLALEIVDNSPSATGSFKKGKNIPARPDVPIDSRIAKFDQRGNMFTERNRFRIDSEGELQGITVKGLLAQRQRRLSFL